MSLPETGGVRILGSCVDGAGHNFQQAITKTFSENPTINGSVATMVHHEIQIFCTRCGVNSRLNELKLEMKNV